MLTINDLKPGVYVTLRGEPHEVLEAKHLKMAQSAGMLQVKMKNLKTGGVTSATFKSNDRFPEAKITKKKMKFIYGHREKLVFAAIDNPSERVELAEEVVGEQKGFLTKNLVLEGIYAGEEFLSITLPPKVALKVAEAPPAERGNTAQSGKKPVIVETGLTVGAPFFIKEGDMIIVNTKTGEYVERTK